MEIQIGHTDNEPIDKNRNKKAMLMWILIIGGMIIQTYENIDWWVGIIPMMLGFLILLTNLFGVKIIRNNR